MPATRPTPTPPHPCSASGNQVTVIGDGNNTPTLQPGRGRQPTGGSNGDTTDGQDGTGAGNQTDADATAPVEASGNQVTVIGDGNNNTADSSQERRRRQPPAGSER